MPYILVVDDDNSVRQMLLLLLRSHDYEAATANNGAEALAMMRERRPCLVLLDIKMPVMDGWEFRDAQLADPALADIPVVCMTGMVHPPDVSRKLGIPCLGKPLDFPSVVRAVERACG